MNDYKILTSKEFLEQWFASTTLDRHGVKCAIFEGVRVYEHIQFGGQDFNLPHLILKNCQINRIVTTNSIIEDITITNSSIGYIVIGYKTQINRIRISNSCFDGIVINALILNRLTIFDKCKISAFVVNASKSLYCSIVESKIDHIYFSETIIDEASTFQIDNCSVNSIIFNLAINKGNIMMSNIDFVNQITVYKDRDNKYLSISNGFLQTESAESPTKLELIASDLGKISFLSCKFENIANTVYFNTKLNDIFTANTQMPEKIILPASINDSIDAQQKLYFSQIKKNYENRGDTINSARSQVLELESYRNNIINSKAKSPLKQKISAIGDRIILAINYHTNRHGTDWVRAILILFCASLLCFVIYCRTLGFKLGSDIELFVNLFSRSFEYLNPFRGTDWFSDLDIKDNSVSRTWDYFSRMIVAFLVYQFLVAFRRFGKNSN